jgi:energy-coupling factor transporter ATP-binding protein EcfA2
VQKSGWRFRPFLVKSHDPATTVMGCMMFHHKISEPHETNDVILRRCVARDGSTETPERESSCGCHSVLKPENRGHYDGNERFLEILKERQEEYANKTRLEKTIVTVEILQQWRRQTPPGRFLIVEEDTTLWKDLGDKKARSFISKALKHLASGEGGDDLVAIYESSQKQDGEILSPEVPEFREAHHKVHHVSPLSRGDSASTATSTIATEGSMQLLSPKFDTAGEFGTAGKAPISLVVEDEPSDNSVKDSVADGRWLKELQYRIYSREHEEAILLRAYLSRNRSATAKVGSGDLCLISGSAGLGKTRLARTLEEVVKEDGGYFLTAKFDQVRQAKPTRIFADAFTEFVHHVHERGDSCVQSMKQTICDALGEEVKVLLSAIPALEMIVGKPSGDPVQMTCQMAQRFVFALYDFVDAVCTPESPIVLLFDDLQWGDPCSLKLLKNFITCNQNKNLFVMATCEDSVDSYSPVSTMLRDLEDKNQGQIFNIEVSQKPKESMREIIMDVLPMSQDRRDALAKLVCQQTGCNPLYILEFLRWLYEEELLTFNSSQGLWTLDDNEIGLTLDSCRLGDFLVDKLEQLPADVQKTISVAASFGSDVDEELLRLVLPPESVKHCLREAARRGILVYDRSKGYSFRHDGLQNASLALIPQEGKDAFHLELGRKLFNGLSEMGRDKHIYLILGQIRFGMHLIKDRLEKEEVALLCLKAGKASARASSFGAAAEYLNLGIHLLEGMKWGEAYGLKLALYNAGAEVELTLANYERVHELILAILDNTRDFRDKIQAYTTQIYAYGMGDQQYLAGKGDWIFDSPGVCEQLIFFLHPARFLFS